MLVVSDSAIRKEADAMTLVGCDLHTRKQQVAVLDTDTGEISEHQLVHEGTAVEEFYGTLAHPSDPKLEASFPLINATRPKATLVPSGGITRPWAPVTVT